MAAKVGDNLIQGKSYSFSYTENKNSSTYDYSETVISHNGKSTSYTSGNTTTVSTFDDGSKVSQKTYSSTENDKTSHYTENTSSNSTYGSGASTVESNSSKTILTDNGKTVTVSYRETNAENSSGSLHSSTEEYEVSDTKQNNNYIKDNTTVNIFSKTNTDSDSLYEYTNTVMNDDVTTTTSHSIGNTKKYNNASGTANKNSGNLSYGEGVSASLLETNVNVESENYSASMQTKVLSGEAGYHAGVTVSKDGVEASIGGEASVTAAEVTVDGSIGDGNLGISGSGTVTAGEASLDGEIKVGYSKNEKTGAYELDMYAKAGVDLVAFKASGTVTGSVGGVDLSVTGGAYVGLGASVKVGIEDNKLVFDISAALGIGFELKFAIGFNEEFWKNITGQNKLPGGDYSEANPNIVVNTDLLRDLAYRLERVNNRLDNLDDALNRVYDEIDWTDFWTLLMADFGTGKSSSIEKARQYLVNTAERFDNAERAAYSLYGG
jgi:hypothetical protein